MRTRSENANTYETKTGHKWREHRRRPETQRRTRAADCIEYRSPHVYSSAQRDNEHTLNQSALVDAHVNVCMQQKQFTSLFLTHLQLSVWVQISVSECEQRLQHHLLGQRAVCVSRACWTVEGEQEASSDHQPLGEDPRGLVQGFTDAADVIVQQPAVELKGGGGFSLEGESVQCDPVQLPDMETFCMCMWITIISREPLLMLPPPWERSVTTVSWSTSSWKHTNTKSTSSKMEWEMSWTYSDEVEKCEIKTYRPLKKTHHSGLSRSSKRWTVSEKRHFSLAHKHAHTPWWRRGSWWGSSFQRWAQTASDSTWAGNLSCRRKQASLWDMVMSGRHKFLFSIRQKNEKVICNVFLQHLL